MKNLPIWLQGLVAAAIGGAANAGGSWLGLATAKGIGLDVPVLNWKSLGVMMLVGGLIGAFAYLKQSPVPMTTSVSTTTLTQEVTVSPGELGK